LFVGNLPAEASEDMIIGFFNQYLESSGVTVQSISLRRGGLKGMSFAHVRFSSGEDCEKAAYAVAGKRLGEGHRVRIDWAVEKPGTERASVNAELRGKTNKIFIAGLNDSIDEHAITSVFQSFGEVTSLRLNRDKAGVRSFGYLTFANPESASAAVDKVSTLTIAGVRIRGDFARPDRVAAAVVEPVSRGRSPSPDYPRITPVSYDVPPEYGRMPSWIECYGNSLVQGVMNQ
jgi:RNA recognition motif-containing protein